MSVLFHQTTIYKISNEGYFELVFLSGENTGRDEREWKTFYTSYTFPERVFSPIKFKFIVTIQRADRLSNEIENSPSVKANGTTFSMNLITN